MSQTIPFTQGDVRVNTPIAETWNYLKINGLDIRLPEIHRLGAVVARLPRIFSEVEVSLGKDAVSWIENSSDDATYTEVKAGEDKLIVCAANTDEHAIKDSGILVRQGAQAHVVALSYGSNAEAEPATSANLVRIIAEAGSHVHITEVIATPNAEQLLHGVGVLAKAGAFVEDRQYVLEGGLRASSFTCELAEEESALDLVLRYFAKGDDVADITHTVRQKGVRSNSKLQSSGLLLDSAQKTLRETIDLIHGAKGAKGNEVETVLIAGEKVINKTLPVILCDEDDVEGNHGASIGSISVAQLDYLAARGISEEAAYALFARSIFDDALIHAPEERAQAVVLASAERALGKEIAQDIAETLGVGERAE